MCDLVTGEVIKISEKIQNFSPKRLTKWDRSKYFSGHVGSIEGYDVFPILVVFWHVVFRDYKKFE